MSTLRPHDVDFAELTGGTVLGPFTTPSVEGMRAMLTTLGERHPEHPFFCRLDRTRTGGGRWVPLDRAAREQRCIEMVSELAPDGPVDPAAWLDQLLQPFPPGRLVHYSIGHGYVQVWFAHIIGDGSYTTITPTLLRSASVGTPPDLGQQETHRLPLTRAVVAHVAKHPRRFVEMLRAPRPDVRASGEVVPVDVPPRFTVQARTAPAGNIDALRRLGKELHPTASFASVWSATIRRAFEKAGVEFATPGFRVLVDARRYLPKNVSVGGNFATAVYLEPDDPRSPTSVDDLMRRNLANGRPLFTMAASATKHTLSTAGHKGGGGQTDRRATLTISYLGRLPNYELLSEGSTDFEYRCANLPEGPSGITVLVGLVAGRATISASYCAQVVRPELIAAALEHLTADPCALLAG